MATPPRFDFITVYAVMRGTRVVLASSDRKLAAGFSASIGANRMVTAVMVTGSVQGGRAVPAKRKARMVKTEPKVAAKKPARRKAAKPSAEPMPDGMTTGEAAKAAGVSISVVASAIKRGELAAHKPKGGGWARIAEPAFMAWSKKRQANASA